MADKIARGWAACRAAEDVWATALLIARGWAAWRAAAEVCATEAVRVRVMVFRRAVLVVWATEAVRVRLNVPRRPVLVELATAEAMARGCPACRLIVAEWLAMDEPMFPTVVLESEPTVVPERSEIRAAGMRRSKAAIPARS